MNSKMLCRGGVFLVLLFVFFGALAYSFLPRQDPFSETCLGVEILSEEEMERFENYQYRDYSENLKLQDEFAPVDEEESVIYISRKIDEKTTVADLTDVLSIDIPGRELFFAPDDAWKNLSAAVAEGHRFQLLVSDYKNTYMQYDVVFTTLPVITMYGELLYKDEDMRSVLSGQFTLWDPSQEDGTRVQSSRVHWHIRGKTSSYQDKKPLKLSLKDWDGRNVNENLLGLGSDDDWILNAMSVEDSNVREKLFMDLWNQLAEEADHNHPMSSGEFVEVLVNGEYHGVYLLQRRVDEKYLELPQEDVLMKAQWNGLRIEYEFSSTKTGDQTQTELIDGFFLQDDCTKLSVDNFVDVNLFLQFFCAKDNLSYKNMFYIFSGPENGYEISMIPWDTDAAMGVVWDSEIEEFDYDYDESLQTSTDRRELPAMLALHPELTGKMCSRWSELREGVFSQENILKKLDDDLKVLEDSGAADRDREKWGLFFEGQDKTENLYRYTQDRLLILDNYYSE